MLIPLKQTIKTSVILLLFMIEGTYLYAIGTYGDNIELEIVCSHLDFSSYNFNEMPDLKYYTLDDTIITGKNETEESNTPQGNQFIIPDHLAKMPIHFKINSDINYLNLNQFVQEESKSLFFHAWLKEKEHQRISIETDSLRKVYSNAYMEQKEVISSLILKNEKKTIELNEEIPLLYQKARDLENQYWEAASFDEKAKFREEIKLYKDSLLPNTNVIKEKTSSIHSEMQDTISLYKPPVQTVEKMANVSEGILYKIKIGAYKGKMSESAKKQIKKLSVIRKVENYMDEKGVKIYTTGKLRLYQEALTMQNQIKQEGIKNAQIEAYLNGKKIPVTEARKLNNE